LFALYDLQAMIRSFSFLGLLLFPALILCAVELRDVFPDLTIFRPVEMTTDGISDSIYILSQPGIVYKLDNIESSNPDVTIWLNLTDRVFGGSGDADERGILGLAFSPEFESTGEFFVSYTGEPGDIFTFMTSHISKFSIDAEGLGDKDTEVKILSVDQPFPNHNGGQIKFGPDDLLYIALGDGGNAGDPYRNGQDLGTLLGKILRIDVLRNVSTGSENSDILTSLELDRICRNVSCTTRRGPYLIPEDNPYATGDGLFIMPEIWAYGLRNPWKFAFDNVSGLVFASDAGQDIWEELDVLSIGGNFGWNIKEGPFCFFPPNNCTEVAGNPDLIDPIYWYDHVDRAPTLDSVVIGGYVYRGSEVPELFGKYLFGDQVRGFIRALDFPDIQNPYNNTVEHIADGFNVASFGEDSHKELYLLDYLQGKIFKFASGSGTGSI